MKRFDINLTFWVLLLRLMSLGPKRTQAQVNVNPTDGSVKGHWNPQNIETQFHNYGFPVRKKELFETRLNYQGYTYAGGAQFPWLVEIRGINSEDYSKQEDWSNGNLMTSKYILTVCSTVASFNEYHSGKPIWYVGDPMYGVNFEFTYVSPKDPAKYKVLYSDDYPYKSVGNGYYTGTRFIKRFIPHPKCNQFELDFQWGIVEVKRPISPSPPWTSYMPTDFRLSGFADIKKAYVTTQANLERAGRCVVGLWARKLNSGVLKDRGQDKIYETSVLLDFKVKYFVVNTSPRDCWYRATPTYPWNRFGIGENIEEWECMAINSNETFGTICDRDRGAPIVCDGYVRAIVLAGAREDACNMTRPVPFLVLDIKYALDIFTELSNREFKNNNLEDFMRVPKQ